MAIYGVEIKGRGSRVLVRESSQAKAVAHFVTATALSAEEMQDALDEGESVWKPGTDLPTDNVKDDKAPDKKETFDAGDEELAGN